MTAHIATVTEAHNTPPKDTMAFDPQTTTDTTTPQTDASLIAEAERHIQRSESQIQELMAELNASPEDAGEISALIALLRADQSNISSALQSGNMSTLGNALAMRNLSVSNQAQDEISDGVEFSEDDELERAHIEKELGRNTSELQQHIAVSNIGSYAYLSHEVQDYFAQSADTMIAEDPTLSSLLALKTMIETNETLHSAIHRCDNDCQDSLAFLHEVADSCHHDELKALTTQLHGAYHHDGVRHDWLPSVMNAFKAGDLDVDQFVEVAKEYLAEERNQLADITERAFSALSDQDKITFSRYVGTELPADGLHQYVCECKSRGLLEPAAINQAYANLANPAKQNTREDELTVAVGALQFNIELHKSLMQMQIAYANLPDDDRHMFMDGLTSMQQEHPEQFQQHISAIIDGNNGLSQTEASIAENLTNDLNKEELENFMNAVMKGNIAEARAVFSDGVIDEHRGEQYNLSQESALHANYDIPSASRASEPTSTITERLPDGTLITHEVSEGQNAGM